MANGTTAPSYDESSTVCESAEIAKATVYAGEMLLTADVYTRTYETLKSPD